MGRQAVTIRRMLVVLVVLVQAAILGRAAWWYGQLPPRFPIHFDASGTPDRWVATGFVAWFGLAAIPLALSLFLGGIALFIGTLVRSAPGLVNVPRKDLFVRLSPERRACVALPTQVFLLWTAAVVSVAFLFIHDGTARVAIGSARSLPAWPVLAIVGGVLLPLPAYWIAVKRAIEAAAREEGLA